jgi:hypothetical protein
MTDWISAISDSIAASAALWVAYSRSKKTPASEKNFLGERVSVDSLL